MTSSLHDWTALRGKPNSDWRVTDGVFFFKKKKQQEKLYSGKTPWRVTSQYAALPSHACRSDVPPVWVREALFLPFQVTSDVARQR